MKNVKLTYCRITEDGKTTWPVIEMDAFELMKDWYNECRVCPENESTVKSCIMDGVELVGNGLDRKPRVEFYDVIAYIESHRLFPDAMLKKLAPDYYERIDLSIVKKLRKYHFFGFGIAARHKKKVDARFTKDGKMLY